MIAPDSLDRLFRIFPSFGAVPPEMRDRVVTQAELVRVPTGTRVFGEGDSCQTFVALLQGEVRVSKPSESGRELLLYYVNPGDFCILTVSCLLGGSTFPAQGMATEEIEGVSLPAALFEELVERSSTFRKDVFGLMGERLGSLLNLVEEVAFFRLDQRLAALLLERAGGSESLVRATHQELADDLGSSREIVSRILASFEMQGLIELGRKRIAILEPSSLSEIS